MRFAMFYRDDTIVGDTDDYEEVTFRVPKAWRNAPVDGLQAVQIHRYDGKFATLHQKDIYFPLPTGEPMCTNDLGPLLRSEGLAKYGLWLPDEEWDQINRRVQEYKKTHG